MLYVMKSDQYQLQSFQYMERIEEKRVRLGENEKDILYKILDSLCRHKCSEPFLKPVDYERLGLLDYPSIILQPMDLETARFKLRDYKYKYVEECLCDLSLIWENCRKYNHANLWLVKWANEMEAYQHRITKNYLPSVKPKLIQNQASTKKKQVKIEENESPKQEVKIEACKIEENILRTEEALVAELKLKAELDTKSKQTQFTLPIKKFEATEVSKPIKIQQSLLQAYIKQELSGHQERKLFLKELESCNDCEVTLIFMMIKRRCYRCLQFDSAGNSTVNLFKIDDLTIALARNQIKIWRNKGIQECKLMTD